MLFGVIDIGSTSVRLMMTDGEKVEKRVNTTRLAENMDEMNTLQPVSIERTAQAVAEYYFVAMQNGSGALREKQIQVRRQSQGTLRA